MRWEIQSVTFVLLIVIQCAYIRANCSHLEENTGNVIDCFNRLFDSVSELENRDQVLVDRINELEILNNVFGDRVANLEQRDQFMTGRIKELETKTKLLYNQIKGLENQNQLSQRVIEKLTLDSAKQRTETDRLKTKVFAKDRRNSNLLQSRRRVASQTQDNRNNKVINAVEADMRPNETFSKGNMVMRAENDISVAFTAVLAYSSFHLGPNQNIVFQRVETNIGNGYNSHQGVFIAPVPGIYVFYSSLVSEFNRTLNCRIVVNGIATAGIYANHLKNSYDQSSQMIVAQLNQGDDVSVQNIFPDGAVYDDVELSSTFSGFLLTQNYGQSGTIIG